MRLNPNPNPGVRSWGWGPQPEVGVGFNPTLTSGKGWVEPEPLKVQVVSPRVELQGCNNVQPEPQPTPAEYARNGAARGSNAATNCSQLLLHFLDCHHASIFGFSFFRPRNIFFAATSHAILNLIFFVGVKKKTFVFFLAAICGLVKTTWHFAFCLDFLMHTLLKSHCFGIPFLFVWFYRVFFFFVCPCLRSTENVVTSFFPSLLQFFDRGCIL